MSFDRYRQPHESEVEWGLRKRFLEAHCDKYNDRNRLLCLASCFINVELYGCYYPNQVMVELKERMGEIQDDVQKFRKTVRDRNSVKFVKASDGAPQSNKNDSSASHPAKLESEYQSISKNNKKGGTTLYAGFVKSSTPTGTITTESGVEEEYPKDEAVSKTLASMSASKALSLDKGNPESSCTFHNVEQATLMKPKSFDTDKNVKVNSNLLKSTTSNDEKVTNLEYISGILQKDDTVKTAILKVGNDLRKAKIEMPTLEPTSLIQVALSRTRVTSAEWDIKEKRQHMRESLFVCTFTLLSVQVSVSEPCTNKKAAKRGASEKAVDILTNLPQFIEGSSPKPQYISTNLHSTGGQNLQTQSGGMNAVKKGNQSASRRGRSRGQGATEGLKRKYNNNMSREECFYDFYIHERKDAKSAVCTVQDSANVNRRHLDWQVTPAGDNIHCAAYMDGVLLGEGEGETRQIAKQVAAEESLKTLRNHCWTVLIKQMSDCNASLSKEQVLGQTGPEPDQGVDYGPASKMMRKMGWEGGGIGKHAQGIVQPVKAAVDRLVQRQGLGATGSSNIAPQVRAAIQEYIQANCPGDLVFSGFSKEDRIIVHNLSKRFNLKSQSYGTEEERQLRLSVKRTASELFRHIQDQGGETDKYSLVPPNQV